MESLLAEGAIEQQPADQVPSGKNQLRRGLLVGAVLLAGLLGGIGWHFLVGTAEDEKPAVFHPSSGLGPTLFRTFRCI